jgi:hypothetical protein
MAESQADVLRHLTEAVVTLTAEVRDLTAQLDDSAGQSPAQGDADEVLARATRLARLRAGAAKAPK